MQLREKASLQVLVVGLGIRGRRGPRLALVNQRHLQRPDDCTGDVVLYLEDIVELSIIGLGPHVVAVVGAHQLRGNAQGLA